MFKKKYLKGLFNINDNIFNDDDKNSDSFKMNSNDLVQNNDLPDSYPTNN